MRYLLLATHYREKVNFTFRSVESAAAALDRIDGVRFRLSSATVADAAKNEVADAIEELESGFAAALADDLNLSQALSSLFVFVRQLNKSIEAGDLGTGDKERVGSAWRRLDAVLGVLQKEDWDSSTKESEGGWTDAEIDDLVRQRSEARSRSDYAEADRVRDLLGDGGVVIEDLRDGVRWKRSS